MDENILTIVDTNFDTEVLANQNLFVLKICQDRACDPENLDALESELAEEYQGEVKFGLLDGEENRFTTNRLLVSKKDTYIFFKRGEEIARFGADLDKVTFKKLIHKQFGY